MAPICPSIPLSLPVCVYVCVHVCVSVSLPKCWSLPCWPSSHQKRGQLVPTCLSPLDPTLLPTSYMQLKLKHNCKAVFRNTHAFHAVGLHLTKDGACWYLPVFMPTFISSNHSFRPFLLIEGAPSIQLISADLCTLRRGILAGLHLTKKEPLGTCYNATCVCPSLGANFPPNQSLWCPPSLPTNQCPPCLPTNHRPFLFGPEWFYFRQAEWVLLPGQPASKYRWLAEEIQTRQWSKYQQLAEEIQTRGSFQRGQNKPTFL